MSRVISTDTPGKVRNQHRRLIAEAMRHLSQKSRLDEEAKDLAAVIVLSLQEIANTIDQTTEAWEKRDYYMKAERFREQWRWVDAMADELGDVVYRGDWSQLPAALARLMPHFSDITIRKLTLKPVVWQGAYEVFMRKE